MKSGALDIRGNIVTGGLYQLVYENLFASAGTSVTISGLDGNTAIEYILICRFNNDYNGTTVYTIRYNNDSGNNYGYQQVAGTNTTASAERYDYDRIVVGYVTALNNVTMSKLCLSAKSGFVREGIWSASYDISGTTILSSRVRGVPWNNTTDNLTSLVITASQTNGIGIGSHILLFARRG